MAQTEIKKWHRQKLKKCKAIIKSQLEQQNISERVDHRSYERQGIEQVPTVHMGVAATQMERRGIITERANMNRVIVGINQKLRQRWDMIVGLKDRLKETILSTVHGEEKPSIMAQLNKYKKEIKETKGTVNAEPPVLAELRARRDHALENLKHIDKRLKNTNGLEEFDKILVERRQAYNEYSALKTEVKNAEASLPNRKPRSKNMER